MLMNLYRTVDRERIQFDFMVHTDQAGSYDAEIEALGGRIYRVPLFTGVNLVRYRGAWNRFFNEHAEHSIVHGHIGSSAAIYLRMAHRRGRVTIAHSHSNSTGPGIGGLLLRVAYLPVPSVADYLFACSDEAAMTRFGRRACERQHYHVVPNGIDTEAYVFDPATREQVRTELGLHGEAVIGHVGRFTQEKNHTFLLDIFRAVAEVVPRVRLLLVGDGPLRPAIERRVAEAGLGGRVICTGVRTDVPRVLTAMDVFCFPSVYEGLPVAIVEAQASGLPVVMADSVPRTAIATDLVTRLSLDESPAHWAHVIAEALARGITRGRPSADAVARAGFDVRQTADWLTQFYGSVIPGAESDAP
jgi:glycosyltransferase involved in cell wall biosynthesis